MKSAFALLAAMAACNANRRAPDVTKTQTAATQPAAGSAATVVSAPAAPVASPIGGDTTQLLTAVVDDWTATTATLRLWHRDGASGHAWVPSGDAWTAVIGATGAAWGDGRHGHGAPAGHDGPTKREGDSKSPAGVFELRTTYGYAAAPPPGASLPYTASDAALRCVDDPRSAHYAQTLEATPAADWASAEIMRRPDALYTWVIDVAHNPDRVAGAGSCIFLHVWSGPGSTTVGCTAMPEPTLAHLLAALDARAHPLYVLLPRAEYAALQRPWDLPAL